MRAKCKGRGRRQGQNAFYRSLAGSEDWWDLAFHNPSLKSDCGSQRMENLSFHPEQGVYETPGSWLSSLPRAGHGRNRERLQLQVMESPFQRCPLLPVGAGVLSGRLRQGTTASRASRQNQALARDSSKLGTVQVHQRNEFVRCRLSSCPG